MTCINGDLLNKKWFTVLLIILLGPLGLMANFDFKSPLSCKYMAMEKTGKLKSKRSTWENDKTNISEPRLYHGESQAKLNKLIFKSRLSGLLKEKFNEEFEFEFLGSGSGGGGSVFRVWNSNYDFSLKVYNKPERLQNDLDAFDVLRTMLELHPSSKIKLPKYQKLAEDVLSLEYIPGVSLKAWTEAETETNFLKKKIKKQIRSKQAKKMYRELEKSILLVGGESKDPDFPHYQIKVQNANPVSLWIHPLNIIVDSVNSSFWIIDPY